jgi:hypothetical protein
MLMISKIVFFVVSPFNERDFKRYGIDILSSNGFEVLVYDFSPLVHPKLYEVGVSDPIEYQKHFCFVNKSDAIKAIRELGSDTFVICMMFYDKRRFWIYRSLSKTRAAYAVSLTNAIPQGRPEDTGINRFLNNFLKKISRVSYTKIRNIPYRTAFSHYLGIRAPDLVIAGGSESLKNYRNSCPFGKETEILWAHTLDYDIFLGMRCKNSVKNANAVFIDPGTLSHGDELAMEIDGILSREKYLPSLRNFFNKVEKETRRIVNIAAHPGYAGRSHPDEFGKRLTIVGKTAEMISQSDFVMTHSSTAISFAVILGKPIIFLMTDEYLARPEFAVDIQYMASWFGKIPINIDHLIDLDWDKELTVDEAYYSEYKNAFIKKDGSEEINIWQIVANRLRSM